MADDDKWEAWADTAALFYNSWNDMRKATVAKVTHELEDRLEVWRKEHERECHEAVAGLPTVSAREQALAKFMAEHTTGIDALVHGLLDDIKDRFEAMG